ncbi:MAG: LysM peptidoglycan-binding domain-containing protein [Bacteroidales bacterium]|nr:LysM peptidoglycan-binding domain-containing protein [Bacteroidales bacterium]
MDIIQFIKLIRKNLLILILVPVILVALVYYGTRNEEKYYVSSSTIYTGLGSGLTLEAQANSRLDYFGSKMEFDNIINIFKARETHKEVALSLFIQGLSLKSWDPQYISRKSFNELQELVPQYIKDMVILPENANKSNLNNKIPLIINDTANLKNKQYLVRNKVYTVKDKESLFSISSKLGISASELMNKNTLTSTKLEPGTELIFDQEDLIVHSTKAGKYDTIPLYIPDTTYYLKAEIDSASFAQTLERFKKYYAADDTNYIYGLLNYGHKYYSMRAVGGVSAKRVQGSDLIELTFKTTDPGICKQCIQFTIDAFKKNYKKLKENQSDNVVAYFEERVAESSMNLQAAENRLLKFNQENNIINYYEQTRHISEQKQILESRYYDEMMIFTAADSVLKNLNKQLANQKGIAKLNTDMLEYRNQLSDITYKITINELNNSSDPKTIQAIADLKDKQLELRNKINKNIDQVFSLQFSAQGVNSDEILSKWLSNTLTYEETKAKLTALQERKTEFQKTYEQFAPLGAKLSRIEREINVYEQQYLSVLNSLNLAKLKQQNLELQSNIKTVDPPYFPLSAESSKRKLFIAAAGIVGLMLVLFVILVLEYFDNTIKTPIRAEKLSGLDLLSAYPLMSKKTNGINYNFITNRLMEQAVQKMQSILETEGIQNKRPINILIFSTQITDGKSLIQDALSGKLKEFGFSVLSANYKLPNYNPKFSFISDEKPIEYKLEADGFTKESVQEILGKENDCSKYDFVLIEIPSITHHAYPPALIKDTDLGILVTRANRPWTSSDENSLKGIVQFMKYNPLILLNGAQAESLEILLGELPRKRSRIRRAAKKLVKLQFFERHTLKK